MALAQKFQPGDWVRTSSKCVIIITKADYISMGAVLPTKSAMELNPYFYMLMLGNGTWIPDWHYRNVIDIGEKL